VTLENHQDKNQINNMANKKIIAGSGSLLPTRSTKFKNRATMPVGIVASLLLFISLVP
jgi:hypothetical protein